MTHEHEGEAVFHEETELALARKVAVRRHDLAVTAVESLPLVGDTNDYAFRLRQPDEHPQII